MAVDLTGGLDPAREFVYASQPDIPEMRESVNTWVWDNGTEFGMPRLGVEAVQENWGHHSIQANIALADGRAFNFFGDGDTHNPLGPDGQARIFGSGPLSYELIEPFKHWKGRLSGNLIQTTTQAQADGSYQRGAGEHTKVPVEAEWDIVHVVPPYEAGITKEGAYVLQNQDEGDLMGGPRFEQLFRATGYLRIGDEPERKLDGGGLRIRRTGIRRLAAFRGHVWQSTVFPSGRAFGHCTYPPREDGKATLTEGFIFEGDGELIPAQVVKAPWLTQLVPSGEDVSVTLEPEKGPTVTIQGESVLSTFAGFGVESGSGTSVRLQQAISRYTLDGESANGMMERSAHLPA